MLDEQAYFSRGLAPSGCGEIITKLRDYIAEMGKNRSAVSPDKGPDSLARLDQIIREDDKGHCLSLSIKIPPLC